MADASGDARMVSAPAGVAVAACRIEALPIDVLIRAISFLDARELVQTCVLSRRWRDLWRSVPRINALRPEFDDMADTEHECDVLFKRFMDRFLMFRNPVPLDEFRLRCNIPDGPDPYAESEDANLWIRHALQSNARYLDVYGGEIDLHLDPAVFASDCSSVRGMLLTLVFLKPPFFRNLQTGCKGLEHLTLRYCTICDPEISSDTLKVLTIDGECHCTFQGQASISTPSLIDLHFHPDLEAARVPLLSNMESLVTASVSICYDDTQVDDIRQFLRSLSGITDLTFNCSGPTLEMEHNLQWCPKFNNLTTLQLGDWCLYEDFYPLIVFLQNSPNLEQLTLKLRQEEGKGFIGNLEERSFTCKRLERVDIVFRSFRSYSKCSKDDPVVNSLVKLLHNNGIAPGQIFIEDIIFR